VTDVREASADIPNGENPNRENPNRENGQNGENPPSGRSELETQP
jgi:hypothetical protein